MCFLVACGAALPSAAAQGLYRPQTPTLSPWFGLYQKNTGPLDSYHYFVRPRMEAYDAYQQQNSAIEQQSAHLNSFGQELTQLQHEGPIRPTGSASVYMNYTHYYPALGTGAAGPSSVTARRAIKSPSGAGSSRGTTGMSRMSGQSGMGRGH
jgi:hypothetical protein